MYSQNSTAQLKCINHSHMVFSQSQNVLISNLEFIGCGNDQMMNVGKLIICDATFNSLENSKCL